MPYIYFVRCRCQSCSSQYPFSVKNNLDAVPLICQFCFQHLSKLSKKIFPPSQSSFFPLLSFVVPLWQTASNISFPLIDNVTAITSWRLIIQLYHSLFRPAGSIHSPNFYILGGGGKSSPKRIVKETMAQAQDQYNNTPVGSGINMFDAYVTFMFRNSFMLTC